jgi:hypothetical protein
MVDLLANAKNKTLVTDIHAALNTLVVEWGTDLKDVYDTALFNQTFSAGSAQATTAAILNFGLDTGAAFSTLTKVSPSIAIPVTLAKGTVDAVKAMHASEMERVAAVAEGNFRKMGLDVKSKVNSATTAFWIDPETKSINPLADKTMYFLYRMLEDIDFKVSGTYRQRAIEGIIRDAKVIADAKTFGEPLLKHFKGIVEKIEMVMRSVDKWYKMSTSNININSGCTLSFSQISPTIQELSCKSSITLDKDFFGNHETSDVFPLISDIRNYDLMWGPTDMAGGGNLTLIKKKKSEEELPIPSIQNTLSNLSIQLNKNYGGKIDACKSVDIQREIAAKSSSTTPMIPGLDRLINALCPANTATATP